MTTSLGTDIQSQNDRILGPFPYHVWLRICVTAADNHLEIRIEWSRCRARRLLWNWHAWVADQKWLSAADDLM
ncbi:MAG: hypothetical protein ABSE82_12655 [Nitrososphaerales archaeon]